MKSRLFTARMQMWDQTVAKARRVEIQECSKMLLPKKVRSLLNGGAAQAGVKGLQDAISALEADMAAHRRELAEIPGKCADAALADDGAAAVMALRSREEELYARLEVAEVQIGRLREKLQEQLDLRRSGLIEHHRREARAKFEKFVPLLAAAIDANDELRSAYESAARELGAGDARRLVTNATFLLPGFTREMIDHWAAATRRELESAAQTPPPSRNRTPTPPTGPVHYPLPNIPHGDMPRRVALYQVPAPPGGHVKPAASAAKHAPAAPGPGPTHGKVARLPRAPLPETPPAGMVRCRVLKNEYPDADGKPLARGDLVDVEAKLARRAVENNAIEFVDPDGEARP
jgi:hypothetical protein